MRFRQGTALLLVALLSVPPAALASVQPATLHGTVKGLSGGPLPGTDLGLINLNNGRTLRFRTDAQGSFAAELPPGLYLLDTAPSGQALLSGLRLVSLAPGQLFSTVWALAAAEEGRAEVKLHHDPIGCMIAGQSPRMDASVEPPGAARSARVYFHSALDTSFSYVQMAASGGAFVAGLPKPQLGAGPVTYYVAASTGDHAETRTDTFEALVVKEEKDCPGRKVAAIFPGGPATAFTAAGASATPAGFAAGISSKALLIAAGAVVAGGTTAILVGSGGNTPPASGSR